MRNGYSIQNFKAEAVIVIAQITPRVGFRLRKVLLLVWWEITMVLPIMNCFL